MSIQTIEHNGFSLAKGKHLTGDDFYAIKSLENITIAVLCDGVGSATEGAEAAKRTTNFIIDSLKNRPKSWSMEKSILHFIQSINRILYLESIDEYQRQELVSTLALVVIEGDRLYGANVGDSRIYLQRDDTLTQLSLDHSSDDEHMSGVLTSAIGLQESITPYYFENNLKQNDRILLCSDGLYTVLSQEELSQGLKLGASFLVKQASKLHNDNLPDDTTAITLHIKEIDPRLKLKQSNLTISTKYRKGDEIDGYKLIKPLVANNRTWLCSKRGVNYVIKFAPAQAADDSKILDLFVTEAWNARRLKAGFFPKAVIPANRTHRYYLMRYIDGITLKEAISKKPLSIDESIELAKFLLKMSQFLIRKDLIHGDIKPENIILGTRKGKRVFTMIDFGSITDAYSITNRAGTPSYLSAERFNGAPATEQSEIYAIGVTLYEALTKEYPFGEIEPFQNPDFTKEPKRPSTYNPKVPKWLESVIMHAINPDTERRYHHYSEFYHDLEHPKRVKPYFEANTSIIQRKPLLLCRIALGVMIIVNIILLTR